MLDVLASIVRKRRTHLHLLFLPPVEFCRPYSPSPGVTGKEGTSLEDGPPMKHWILECCALHERNTGEQGVEGGHRDPMMWVGDWARKDHILLVTRELVAANATQVLFVYKLIHSKFVALSKTSYTIPFAWPPCWSNVHKRIIPWDSSLDSAWRWRHRSRCPVSNLTMSSISWKMRWWAAAVWQLINTC